MAQFTSLTSKMASLPINDIDTDQIIPAQFLKVTDKDGLGQVLFHSWRYLADGSPNPEFVLNQPRGQGAQILLAGDNFGCGSSREHAPWALLGYGFRAVISTSFADIFRNNALKNGLLPIAVDPATYQALLDLAEEAPDAVLEVDLATQTVRLPGGQSVTFPIDGFSKSMLLRGVDELGYLMSFEDKIVAYERNS